MFDRKKWTGTREQRIDLGLYLGLENHDDAFIKLRELTVGEGVALKSKQNNEDRYEEIKKLLPDLIIEHNFYNGDEKMDNKEVACIIGDSFTMLNCVSEMFWAFSFFILPSKTLRV